MKKILMALVAFVVMKITSFAIHMLVLAALVFIAMHVLSRFRGRGQKP